MADEPCPLPAGTVLRFGSFDFVATGDGYDMELPGRAGEAGRRRDERHGGPTDELTS